MYYWHSVAIRAGYKNEKDMAVRIYKEIHNLRKIGRLIGKYAGVQVITGKCIKAFLHSQGIKLTGKPGRPRIANKN